MYAVNHTEIAIACIAIQLLASQCLAACMQSIAVVVCSHIAIYNEHVSTCMYGYSYNYNIWMAFMMDYV